MLVLSRGRNEKVVFPTLGISVEILRVAGNKVRLGIDAPREVPVHRHELAKRIEIGSESDVLKLPRPKNEPKSRMSRAVRNRLHAAAQVLQLLHKSIEAGDLSDVEPTIFKVFDELKKIETELEGNPAPMPDSHREEVVSCSNEFAHCGCDQRFE